MSREELVDVYISSFIRKADQVLIDYAHGRKSWIWEAWGKEMIYWMED